MTISKLTDAAIARARLVVDLPDPQAPGLVLRNGKNVKSWKFRDYQDDDRYYSLGRYPDVSIEQARAYANRISNGDALAVVAELAGAKKANASAPTLQTIIDRYVAEVGRTGRGAKTLDEKLRIIGTELKGYLKRPVADITAAHLRSIREKILARGASPARCNRVIHNISAVLSYAEEYEIIEMNPARKVKKLPEAKRTRVLTDPEFKAIILAARGASDPVATSYGRLVEFCALMANRRGEAAVARYQDVDDQNVWRMADTKSGEPHEITLSTQACKVVGQGEAPHKLIFPSRGDSAIAGWGKLKARLDERSGVSDWHLHDLRGYAATKIEILCVKKLKFDRVVVQHILNHAVNDTTGLYAKYMYEDEMAEALQAWGDLFDKIVGTPR